MREKLEDLFRVTKKQLPLAVKTFVKAFSDDPLAKYMFGQRKDRNQKLGDYFNFRINYGIIYGEVYAATPKIEGLAVWISNENSQMTQFKMLRAGGMRLYRKMGKEIISKMMEIEKYTSKIHHRNATMPHWHLTPIGVDPEHQGKGFASKLIRAMLNRLDQEEIACFLETQSKKNVEIYKHFDFKIVEEVIIPKADLPHWAMIRMPSK